MSHKRIVPRQYRGQWYWYGHFKEHPKKDGRPAEKKLSDFQTHPAKKDHKGKWFIPESDEVLNQLMDLWFLKRLEIEEDKRKNPFKYQLEDLGTLEQVILEYQNSHYFNSRLSFKKRLHRISQYRFWIKKLGKLKVHEVHPGLIERIKDEMRKKYKPSTINDYLNALSAVYKQMGKHWRKNRVPLIPENPILEREVVQETIDRVLTLDEIQRLLDATAKIEKTLDLKGLDLCVNLALDTGGRLREVCGLKWENVDLEKGWVSFVKTKNKRPRTLELTPQVLKMFRDFSKVRRIDNPYVFAGMKNNFTEFKKPFKKALKMAGIENFTFHGLRHTFGTYMALNGMQQNKISSALGHVQTRSTERYLHIRPEQSESAGIMETLRNAGRKRAV